MRRHFWFALVVGFSAACSDGSTIQVSYSAGDPYADPALLTVDLAWPGSGRRLEGRTFTTTTEFGAPHSPVLDVPTGGQLQVRARLVTPEGDTLAQVAGP